MDSNDAPAKWSTGQIIFWCFLAALVLLLVFQYFEIQDKCYYYEATDRWQKTFC
jgi:hypothetical protein